MKLLILGGTRFLGRAVVEAALVRGHELTLFNRGETDAGLYPEAEQLRGDRDGKLAALDGRCWDAVVDLSGYVPHVVRASAELLRDSGHYTFISSVSVYADLSGPVSETSPLAELGDAPVDKLAADSSNYGALKALCESAVEEVFGHRCLIARPGLIVGPHDPTGRFTYWAHRLARGGELLAPGPPDRRVQFVDVRDLATWLVASIDRGATGVFNATSEGVAWGDLLADSEATWVSDGFLVEHEVGEWLELPLWIADPAFAGMHRIDVSTAVAAGLRVRLVADTLRGAVGAPAVAGVGLTPEREAQLLADWYGRSQ